MEYFDKINVLGISFDRANKKVFQNKIIDILAGEKQSYIVTPNPEIVLNANHDEKLHHIINSATLSIPDGIGIKFASWLQGKNLVRWAGSDICLWLLKYAETEAKKVAIFNLKNGLSSGNDINWALKKKYPDLNFAIESIDKEWSLAYYQNINVFKPEIIFITTGSPYQEKFIYKNLPKMPFVKLAIGVGGSFDYISAKVKPSPAILKLIGLEWLWRLINIKSYGDKKLIRTKRIINAIFLFPYEYLKWLLINPFQYRKNVACLIYKIDEAKQYKILLIKRNDNGAWQIPQGGIDGDSIESAAIREIQEELGTKKIKILDTYKNLHKYTFPKKENHQYRNYKGQSQSLAITKYTGDDSDLKIREWEYIEWKWFTLDEAKTIIEEVRQESFIKYIKKLHKTIQKYEKS